MLRRMTIRDYASAINLLNTLQSNAAVIESIRKQGGKNGSDQVLESIEYWKRIGYQVEFIALSLSSVSGGIRLTRAHVLAGRTEPVKCDSYYGYERERVDLRFYQSTLDNVSTRSQDRIIYFTPFSSRQRTN